MVSSLLGKTDANLLVTPALRVEESAWRRCRKFYQIAHVVWKEKKDGDKHHQTPSDCKHKRSNILLQNNWWSRLVEIFSMYFDQPI